MMQDTEQHANANISNLFILGFRCFFLGAAVFAVISMVVWALVLFTSSNIIHPSLPTQFWHAHEMIFGYSAAVIAGFLLTAVKTWTKQEVPSGYKLAFIFCFWVGARLAMLFSTELLLVALVLDTLFLMSVIVAISLPIIKVKQWRQLAIITKLVLLCALNALFYIAVINQDVNLQQIAIYTGFYLIIALILTMARRVMPMFIANGLGLKSPIRNNSFIDMASLVLLALFIIFEVLLKQYLIAAWLSLALFVIHSIRLSFWYRNDLWKKSVLWSLYLAICWITLGFLLLFLSYYFAFAKSIAIHAFSVGGIGLISLSMMSRVSLGHSGRSVFNPPSLLIYLFSLMTMAAVVRVFMPLIDNTYYLHYMGLSQLLWCLAFLGFIAHYWQILSTPRVS